MERRARHALARARSRLHLVEGFLSALGQLDAVVKVGGPFMGVFLGGVCYNKTADRKASLSRKPYPGPANPTRSGPPSCLNPPKTPAAPPPKTASPATTKARPAHPPKSPPTSHHQKAIRDAADAAGARAALCAPPFGLSPEQAEGVLGLTLRRLTGLEVGKLREEEGQLRASIQGLEVGGR